jgi:hypothetical protein
MQFCIIERINEYDSDAVDIGSICSFLIDHQFPFGYESYNFPGTTIQSKEKANEFVC